MEIQIAAVKINKYAVSESGDTLEVVERPGGGLSVVLADGQSSGRGAKAVSLAVVRRVIGLLADGVRDGAAARAASDTLFIERAGKVSCTLNIASIDLLTKTLVLTRNNPAPIYILHGDRLDALEADSQPLGTARNIRPVISEVSIEPGLTVVFFTDGIVHAGSRRGAPMNVPTSLRAMFEDQEPHAQNIADALLAEAVRLDENRPADDISVVVMRVNHHKGDATRRLNVRLPINL